MLSIFPSPALLHEVTAMVKNWPLQHCEQPWSRAHEYTCFCDSASCILSSGSTSLQATTHHRINVFHLKVVLPAIWIENSQHGIKSKWFSKARSSTFWSFGVQISSPQHAALILFNAHDIFVTSFEFVNHINISTSWRMSS